MEKNQPEIIELVLVDELYVLQNEEENKKYYKLLQKKLKINSWLSCHAEEELFYDYQKETYNLDKIVEYGLTNMRDDAIYNLIKNKLDRFIRLSIYNHTEDFYYDEGGYMYLDLQYSMPFVKNKEKHDKIKLYNNYKFFYKLFELLVSHIKSKIVD